MQTSTEYDKRQVFLFNTQPQAKPAKLVQTGLSTGKQTAENYE
jgi:hypothetical protein